MTAFIEVVALAVIVLHAACALNRMSRATRWPVMIATSALFAATFARLLGVTVGEHEADPSVAAILAAIALGMMTNRRRRPNCPCLPAFRSSHDKEGHAHDRA